MPLGGYIVTTGCNGAPFYDFGQRITVFERPEHAQRIADLWQERAGSKGLGPLKVAAVELRILDCLASDATSDKKGAT